MTMTTVKTAEEMVETLIADTNRDHSDKVWYSDITTDVETVEITCGPRTCTLWVNPLWLDEVIAAGTFDSRVAGEIESCYRLMAMSAETVAAA